MSAGFTLLVTFLVFAVGFALVRLIRAAGLYRKLRAKCIVICPETKKPATLDIAAGPAAMEALLGKPHLRLIHCSHWPERQNCAQPCLIEMQVAPDVSIPEPDLCD